MAINSKHPLYADFLLDWSLMVDAHKGERQIKEAGPVYLLPTSGQLLDGMAGGQPGLAAYTSYKARAVFPDIVRAAVEAMIGVMHHKPPVIELPAKMEPMREMATVTGESLEMLLLRINEAQLITGRVGLLLDVLDGANIGTMPYIATYDALNILNWDDGQVDDPVNQNLNFVALNESEFVRSNNFDWEFKDKYRVLILGDADANEAKGEGTYQTVLVNNEETSLSNLNFATPSIGGNMLDQIPFVFINTKDVVPDPDTPPLLGLANLAVTIYRGEADYRQALFMQGQDTLVVTGSTDEDGIRMGANAVIKVPIGGDAKFIGVDSRGLAEMRSALENDKNLAVEKGGQLIDTTSRAKESGEALKIRVAARTATLNQVVLAGAFGLQQLLRIAAEWVGADPEQVIVTPNLDFADDSLAGKTLVEYMTAKSLGAPFSLQSIHNLMRQKDLTELEFEEELAAINEEVPLTEPVDDDDDDDTGAAGDGGTEE